MALHNQPGLYNEAVNLNPLPYVNIAMQARARKQAREDAIDKYYQKLPDTINDKGVRDQEIPIINDIKDEIFSYAQKNKEALRNPKLDKGAAQFGLQQLFRKGQSVSRLSQNAGKIDLQAGKLYLNKDNGYILNNEDYIADHDLHNLPVTDPNHKTLDINKYAANRPFDQDKFVKLIKTQFPYSEKVNRTTDPTNSLYDIVTTTPVLDDKTKQGIYAFAADKLHNDFTFERKIKKDLAGTGQLDNLQKVSQEVFGKPIETDEDLAAAYTASQMYTPPTKEKSDRDIGAVMDKQNEDRNKEWDRRTGINQRNSLIKIAANKQGQQVLEGTTGNALDELGGVNTYYLPNSGGKIEKGIVYDKDGYMYNGNITMPKELLPANVSTALIAAKIPVLKFMDIVVKDGVVQAINTPNGQVSRQAMENLQKKVNTEPIKAPQPVYGKPNSSPAKKITIKKGELDDLQ